MNKKNKDALLEAQNLTDKQFAALKEYYVCLLYTSDAADES